MKRKVAYPVKVNSHITAHSVAALLVGEGKEQMVEFIVKLHKLIRRRILDIKILKLKIGTESKKKVLGQRDRGTAFAD